MNALIFIDTNIFLDFYRIRNSEVSMSYLKLIEEHKSYMITGCQVEMEYKKNRQVVILDSQGKFKAPDWSNLSVPALLTESDEFKKIKELKKEITQLSKKIGEEIEKILKFPEVHDPVFKSLQTFFQTDLEYNLTADHELIDEIRKKANARFILGYPPRKKNDTSIGDSINWEWIVHCASVSKKDIIIVTRDTDFGINIKSNSFINDWLNKEFKERVSSTQKIVLTTRLSEALKEINATVSKAMEDEETRIIESYSIGSDVSSQDKVTGKIFDILKNYD